MPSIRPSTSTKATEIERDLGPGPNRWHGPFVALAGAFGAFLLLWSLLGTWSIPAIGAPQYDYYNLLVHGFRKGTVSMDVPVPDALKHDKPAWEVARDHTPGLLHDVSYYHGRFYLYFGVVPAVILFWPFTVLTGHDLPFVYSAIVFALAGFAVGARLWLAVLKEGFPKASLLTKIGGLLVLGLAGGQFVLVRRVSFWEEPIAAGHCFILCMLAAGFQALRSKRPHAWLAAAGLSLGLAIGCRPTLAAAGLGLAALVTSIALHADSPGRIRRMLACVLAAGIPFTLIAAAIMAYNHARFGNPFEFGLNYQLSDVDPSISRHFSVSYVPFNFRTYFLTVPWVGRYFPFLTVPIVHGMPKGYYGTEYAFGILATCPVLGWILFAPLLGSRRERGPVRQLTGIMALIAVPTALLLLCFDTVTPRYEVDFLPWWLWLTALGWACLEARLIDGNKRPIRIAASTAFGAAALVSCAASLCINAQLFGILKFINPTAYTSLARALDGPTGWWEQRTGFRGGALEMTVVFPSRVTQTVEPLAAIGREEPRSFFFVRYEDPNHLQLGFSGLKPSIMSPVISVQPGRAYRIRLESGALNPPIGHPLYDGWTQAEIQSATNWARIDMDGRPVLDQPAPTHEAAPDSIEIGRDDESAIFGKQFSGKISGMARSGVTRPLEGSLPTDEIRLDLTFPPDPGSANEPLVQIGRLGHAEVVGLRFTDPTHFMPGFEEWGSGYWEGAAVVVPEGRKASFRIRIGACLDLAGNSPASIMKDSVVVWMNGRPIYWKHRILSFEHSPPLSILTNSVGSSAMSPSFEGRLESWGAGEAIPAWQKGPFRALELELGGRGTGIEPVVATGSTGKADTLVIEWLPNGRARFSYDHWGEALRTSLPFDWDDAQSHVIRAELPSLSELDSEGPPTTGTLQVDVDGRPVWKEQVSYHRCASSTVQVARNAAGSSISAPEISAVVIGMRQIGLGR